MPLMNYKRSYPQKALSLHYITTLIFVSNKRVLRIDKRLEVEVGVVVILIYFHRL